MGTPEIILNCKPMFRKFVDPQIQNTLLMDIVSLLATEALDSTDDQNLPPQLKSIAYMPDSLKDCMQKHFGSIPASTSIFSQLMIARITYSVALKHSRNSCVLFDSVLFQPAQIEYIAQFISKDDISGVKTLVAVVRFK